MRQLAGHPIAPLVIFTIALSALLIVYIAAAVSPSGAFEFVASFSWSLLLALWVVADARRQTGIPCFDFGFFCYLFLPVASLGIAFGRAVGAER
jgi:hypothetical protein